MPTIPVARVLIRRSCAAAIGNQRTVSQKLLKAKNTAMLPRRTIQLADGGLEAARKIGEFLLI
jgi:hypothetical protein